MITENNSIEIEMTELEKQLNTRDGAEDFRDFLEKTSEDGLRVFELWLTLNGYKKEVKRSLEYENSAHMVKVIARGTINLIENHDEENFLYLHDSYIHPSLILKHDNIVLKGINSKYAIFCVSENNVCTLDTSIGPFAWANMFIASKKLIFLPLKHFHRLAEESGDPFRNNLRISMIHMTARCGSTLLGNTL